MTSWQLILTFFGVEHDGFAFFRSELDMEVIVEESKTMHLFWSYTVSSGPPLDATNPDFYLAECTF